MHKERVVRGAVSSEHIVQLFDSVESLADAVGAFLAEGFVRGDALLAVVTPEHWEAIADRLAQTCPIEDAVLSGRLVVLDAQATLDRCLRYGMPELHAFRDIVERIVTRITTETGRPLRIYGEMVELLAREGDFRAAQRLEDFWNELAARVSFTLFCGYQAVHFGDPQSEPALRLLCQTHTKVMADPADGLACWLVSADTHTDTQTFVPPHAADRRTDP